MKDKVVIITGATSGIGKALAYEYGAHGAKLVLGARNYEKLDEIKKDLTSKNIEVLVCQADVSKESDCKNLILTATENFNRIDILINNAGISMRALFINTDLDVIRKLMQVNFWGTVYCTKFALPYLLKSKGSIVGISSIAGIKGLPARTGYSASKFAMNGFMESLRTENLKNRLHVLVAHPGFTASNIRNTALTGDGTLQGETPRNEDKMMSAEEVAHHIFMAVQKRKNKLILTTEGKLVSLISKFFPKMLENMVYNNLAKEPDSPFN